MLQQTFCHIPGIGTKTERQLWAAGITSWNLWQPQPPIRLSAAARHEAAGVLQRSLAALDNDPAFFVDQLGSTEPWRIFPHFRDRTVYLDIETTGLDDYASVTTIALYDGKEVFTYINGRNLDDFVDDIEKYQVIVSYNGKCFDIPFLERFFHIRLPHAQIDLRYVLARLGIKGGLKGCEKQLGLHRGSLDGVDGYFAVLLWQRYQQQKDEKALETLLAYNIEDTVNLERLMVEAYNRNLLATPFAAQLTLPPPASPANPYWADYDCIEKIKRAMGSNLKL